MKYLADYKKTKRRLPHIQVAGSIYFITFVTKNRSPLSKEAKQIVHDTILFHQNKKYELFSFVIMSDHVHILLQPLPKDKGYYDLSEIMHSIKSFSSSQINKMENKIGRTLWLSESYDTIVRTEKDFWIKMRYIEKNHRKEITSLLYWTGRDACPTLSDAYIPVKQASLPADREASLPADREASLPADREASLPAVVQSAAVANQPATAFLALKNLPVLVHSYDIHRRNTHDHS
jgi:putative transposase